jgi:hypothetical protein
MGGANLVVLKPGPAAPKAMPRPPVEGAQGVPDQRYVPTYFGFAFVPESYPNPFHDLKEDGIRLDLVGRWKLYLANLRAQVINALDNIDGDFLHALRIPIEEATSKWICKTIQKWAVLAHPDKSAVRGTIIPHDAYQRMSNLRTIASLPEGFVVLMCELRRRRFEKHQHFGPFSPWKIWFTRNDEVDRERVRPPKVENPGGVTFVTVS